MDDDRFQTDIPLSDEELAYLQALVWETAHLELNGPAHELAKANGFHLLQLEGLRRALGNRRAAEVMDRKPTSGISWPWRGLSPESIIERLENRVDLARRPRLAYQDLTPESRAIMIESRRRYRLAHRQAAGGPFTGLFCWIPLPNGDWELVEFADAYYGGQADHTRVWKEVVAVLAFRWGKDSDSLARQLASYPYGLPGGRVVQTASDQWQVALRKPAPMGTNLKTVIKSYNLPTNKLQIILDHPPCVIPEHVERVRNALGAGYELAEPMDSSDGGCSSSGDGA
jgi:hypothetical protein